MNKYYINIVFLILFIPPMSNFSQSLTGMSGGLTIPTAEILKDGEICMGINLLPKVVLNDYGFSHTSITPYISLGFLPFAEFSLRSTYPIDGVEYAAVGDRMPSIRLKIRSDNNLWPAVAIGVHDFLTVFGGNKAIYFNSVYLVFSKKTYLIHPVSVLNATIGYGSDFLKAGGHQFIGIFGGIEATISFAKNYFDMSLITEYDGKKFNAGSRIKLLNHVNILFGLFDLKYASGGLSFSFLM